MESETSSEIRTLNFLAPNHDHGLHCYFSFAIRDDIVSSMTLALGLEKMLARLFPLGRIKYQDISGAGVDWVLGVRTVFFHPRSAYQCLDVSVGQSLVAPSHEHSFFGFPFDHFTRSPAEQLGGRPGSHRLIHTNECHASHFNHGKGYKVKVEFSYSSLPISRTVGFLAYFQKVSIQRCKPW